MELTQPLPRRLTATWQFRDGLFAVAMAAAALFALWRYGAFMNGYEKGILLLAAPLLTWLGWQWRSLANEVIVTGALALLAIYVYRGDLGRADTAFFLKYFISSQSAILWMAALFYLATLAYWTGLIGRSEMALGMGSGFTWAAVTFGCTGLLVRWYESYLIGTDVGHVPVSNLYEVFILFSLITALFYLFYQRRYATRQLGAFVLLVISAAVGFLLWYSFARQAEEIQPLVPALQSWWMKIHVPANFIGYGTFSLAAMVAYAQLLKTERARALWIGLVAVPAGLLAACGMIELLVVRTPSVIDGLHHAYALGGGLIVLFAAINALRPRIAARLPDTALLDDLTYKAITIGFTFFTIATILGALWAAEAWGSYWSWDPKETWALIVWLNYAAWLHMRLMKGLRGTFSAWWALIGLLITCFAFLGVNMFLSGLHSYGQL